MSDKVKLYGSAKELRMHTFEVANSLYRKESALKKVETLEFEGIYLQTEQKQAFYYATVRGLRTIHLDHLMKVFNQHFDDYELQPSGSRIKVIAYVYYGVEE